MTATLATLRTRLRDRLNETNTGHWSNEMLGRFINEGAREVARVSECLLATGTVAAVAGTRSYALSALSPQPVRIHRVEYNISGQMQRCPLNYRDYHLMDEVWGQSQSITTGIPSYWTAWGFFPTMTMYSYPVPASAGTFTLFYYRLPTELDVTGAGDSTALDCPDGWEDVIVTYAEHRAFRNDNDDRWITAKAMFDEQLANLMRITMRPSDSPGFITTDIGFVPAWLAAQ